MTTTKSALTLAKVAEAANTGKKIEKGEGFTAKDLIEGKKPTVLKDLLDVLTEKAKLARNREQLINHLDMVNNLDTEPDSDALEGVEGIMRIEIYDKHRNRYDIKNPTLLIALVIELKAQIRAKISEIEIELMK